MADPYIVLVTGGSGCLGQHVIGLLQSRVPHVTEIRVLDIVEYVNKLDYVERVPVQSFVGGINDEHLLKEACKGVVSVFHLAAVADNRLFPDSERTHRINVEGTASLLKVAKETSSVKRFIFCSSTSICMSKTNGSLNVTEDAPLPEKRVFDPYAISKYRAEQLVIKANGNWLTKCENGPSDNLKILPRMNNVAFIGSKLTTVSLRPVTMYGELDEIFISQTIRAISKIGGVLVPLQCGGTVHQHAYVGNVAWGFVCVENKLYNQHILRSSTPLNCEEDSDCPISDDDDLTDTERYSGNIENSSIAGSVTDISGQVYNIIDDTKNENLFQFQKRFLEPCGYRVASFMCPAIVVFVLISAVYYIFKFLYMLGFKPNLSNGTQSIVFTNNNHTFSGEKAKKELNYWPLFTFQESFTRSLAYYRKHFGWQGSR